MKSSLKNVVPWGRSYDEYVAMFDLSGEDLKGAILGCADGPAAFNAELTKRGGKVVSVDPLYAHSAEDIRSRIDDARTLIIEATRRNMDAYIWRDIPSIDALESVRMGSMEIFLEDYEAGRVGRTVHSRSGKNQPPHRPRRVFDREKVVRLRKRGLSLRQIADEMEIGLGTVVRTLSDHHVPE